MYHQNYENGHKQGGWKVKQLQKRKAHQGATGVRKEDDVAGPFPCSGSYGASVGLMGVCHAQERFARRMRG